MRTVLFLVVLTAMLFLHLARWVAPPSSRNAVQWKESADPPAIEQTGSFEDQAITVDFLSARGGPEDPGPQTRTSRLQMNPPRIELFPEK